MSAALIGWNNYVKTGTVTASEAAANFPVTNLQGDQGAAASAWQTNDTGPATLTITPALTQRTWRALGLFRTNLTSAASLVFSLFNNPSTLVATATLPGPVNGTGQVVWVLGADTVADYATVAITDAGNPQGYLNVPLAFAGPAWNPLTGFSFATALGRDGTTDEAQSRGGQEYPVFRWQRRRWDYDMQGVRASELWLQLDAMLRTARTGANIFTVPDTTSANLASEALFGRIASLADVTFPFGTADRRAAKLRHTERL